MAINTKKFVARGMVALAFGATVTVGSLGSAQASCADGNYASSADKQACEQWSNDQAQTAQTQQSTQSTTNNGPYTDPKTGHTYTSYQEYYNACVGPSDVDPNWQPAATCAGTNTGQSQQVPTYVPAGGQAPANYDATNNRSADTLVLP